MANFNLNDLNEKQKEAALAVNGAVLVTAGAGSGKTRVLTYRIAKLMENGVKARNILAVTFTNKAAKEMKERISAMVENVNVNNLWISTFHSMCVKLLRENNNIAFFNNYTTNFSIYDTTDKERILKAIIAEKQILEEDFLKKVSWHISNRKNKNMSFDEYALELGYFNKEVILEVMKSYEAKMNASNALDFDSLLTYTYNLLALNPEVLEYYQNKFEFIHIDEFQDTNKVQYDLIKLLSAKHKNVFVVGDEDQCIYTWRGANSSHIFSFTKDFAPVKIIKLEQNYRSTKKIIELANKVISHNTSRLEKKLWTDKSEGVRVEHSTKYNQNYEAEFVAEHIYNLVRMNNYNYSDIAVLMRLNALTRNFENKLLGLNIPYRIYGGMKFYDRLEIKNVLGYLKLLVNPKDNASFNRIINYPKRGIGKAALLALKDNMQEGESAFEAVLKLDQNANMSKGALNKFLQFKALMQNLLEKKDEMQISDFLEYVLDMANINESYNSGSEEDASRLLNLSELVNSIKEYEKNNEEATLEEYLQSVSLTSDIDNFNEDDNKVTLATVHSVKGLEFKVVFIVGCEEGIFPIKRSDSTDDDIEEERRLMYVAITRAEERLYLTSTRERMMYGQTKYMTPSRFLKEAGLIGIKLDTESGLSSTSYANKYASSTANQSINTSSTASKQKVKDIVTKLKVNDKVSHPKFGVGVVMSISGSSATKTAKIHFEGVGSKILALNFAPLTIL